MREDAGGLRIGRIVEVEAYIGTDDLASHARVGRTARNAVMFGPPGRAYLYLVYGMYECLNVVTEADGTAAALLIRAVEPITGADRMRAVRMEWTMRRRSATPSATDRIRGLPDVQLAAGPGLVTIAFGVGRRDTGRDLCDPESPIRLELAGPADRHVEVIATPRVGIDFAPPPWHDNPWRLIDAASPAVSGPRRTKAAPPNARKAR